MSKAKDTIERFAKYQAEGYFPCPRCGRDRIKKPVTHNALSRHVDVYICDACGMDEAIRDITGRLMPNEEWAIIYNPEIFFHGEEVYV